MTDFEPPAPVAELPPPTPKGRPVQKYVGVAEWLRQSPGEWFPIERSERSQTTSNMRAGKYPALPKGEFEFESRKEDGLFVTYARKIPEGER